MAVRIRVYPQYGGMGGMGMGMGMGMNGGAVSASTYYNSKLQTQRQVSSLQLGYERALWGERLDKVRLEERLKNPYLAAGTGFAGAYGGLPVGLPMGGMPMGLPMGMPMGGLPMGGVPGGFGGFGGGFGGAGQTNITNQTSTGGHQTVSNVNTNNHSHVTRPPHVGFGGGWGSPFGFGGGGGGFLSGLLGALI